MIEFKKSVSFIDNSNWLYFAHHEFSIFSLDKNEIVYCEKEPFGKRYNQISKIVYSEKHNRVIVISFRGDFCIYQIDHKSSKVVKAFIHIQKGNFYCSDARPIRLEKDYIIVTIERKEECFFRSIFFDGKITDSEYFSPMKLANSIPLDVFSKTIGNQLITIEIKWKIQTVDFKGLAELDLPFISGYVFDNGREKININFDESFIKQNELIHLSSFNDSYVSFVSTKRSMFGSLIVLPIKKD